MKIPGPTLALWLFLLAAAVTCGCSNQAPPSTTPSAPGASASTSAPPAADDQKKDLSVAELLAPTKAAAPANAAAAAPASVPSPSMPPEPGQPATEAPADRNSAPLDDSAFARVVSVQPIPGPRQICTDQTIVERRHPGDRHHVAGTVIGAIVGGAVGSRFGRGSGRTVATVGGAVAGGAVGREIQRDREGRETVTRVVTRCRPARAAEAGVALYDVVYAYQGQNFHVRLDRDPGDRIALPVRGVE